MEIAREGDDVVLKQTSYIERMTESFLPDGVPASFTRDLTPADVELPRLVESALTPDATLAPDR